MTFEAEYIDTEFVDAEYAKYVNAAAGSRAKKRLDWSFWAALAALALLIYTAAFFLQARHSASASPAIFDLHDCTLPEVKVEFARPNTGEHDIISPYAHSVCKEGDVRLWESIH